MLGTYLKIDMLEICLKIYMHGIYMKINKLHQGVGFAAKFSENLSKNLYAWNISEN